MPLWAERKFWTIRRSQPVQVDRLVSYPLIFLLSKVKVQLSKRYNKMKSFFRKLSLWLNVSWLICGLFIMQQKLSVV